MNSKIDIDDLEIQIKNTGGKQPFAVVAATWGQRFRVTADR
jgi:hypothetical protein